MEANINSESTAPAIVTEDCKVPSVSSFSENKEEISAENNRNGNENVDNDEKVPVIEDEKDVASDAIRQPESHCFATAMAGSGSCSDFIREALDVVIESAEDEEDDVDMENISNASSMGSSYVEIDESNQGSKGRIYDSYDWTSDAVQQDADGVIVFNMTLQERLLELHDIFENFGQGGLCLTNVWTLYFETYIEPMGWLALWKRRDEENESLQHNMSFSSGIYTSVEKVEITQVNCATLSARVKKADDTVLWAQLKELFPLAEQENSFLSMKVTAKCIDNYRFFMNHLLFPWDTDNADQWLELHLESRVQFYYDLQSGAVPETLAKEIKSLMQEAKINKKKIEVLEEKLNGVDDDEDFVEEPVVAEMLPLHIRQDEIKSRLKVLEKPMWRNIVGKQKTTPKIEITEKLILITPFACNVAKLQTYLQCIEKEKGSDVDIRILPSLEETLRSCEPNVTIFLVPGTHRISGLGNLEKGGSIVGLVGDDDQKVVIEPKDSGDVWLVVDSDSVVSFQNVTVTVTKKWTLPNVDNDIGNLSLIEEPASSISFLVSHGTLSLQNVAVTGFVASEGLGSNEEVTTGIKALNLGKINLLNSSVKHFIIGVAVREEAQLEMVSSEVTDCRVGMEINAGIYLTMKDVNIQRCQKYGILAFSRSDTATVIGTVSLLDSPLIAKVGIEVTNVCITDCIAGEICVCNEVKFEEDLGAKLEDANSV